MTKPIQFLEVKTIKCPCFASNQLRDLINRTNYDLRDSPVPDQTMEIRADPYRVTTAEFVQMVGLYRDVGMLVSDIQYDPKRGPSFLISAPFCTPERNRELVADQTKDKRSWRRKLKAALPEGTQP